MTSLSSSSVLAPMISESLPAAAFGGQSSIHALPAPFQSTQPRPQLITQGAEALVYKTIFLDYTTPAALKFRPSKPYRHPTLDGRLTKQRVLAEARVLLKLAGLKLDDLAVPAVLSLEWDVSRKVKGLGDDQKQASEELRVAKARGAGTWLLMEWIDGASVKELLREWDAWYKRHGVHESEEVKAQAEDQVQKLLRRVGKAIAVMHSKGGVVHGDLTSSNIMVRSTGKGDRNVEPGEGDPVTPPDLDGEIVLIDFGLAVQSVQEEDRAVDLYVLERAFGSTHPRQESWFNHEVLQNQEGYRGAFKGANNILKRLEEVRMRGRKRTMVG